MSFLRLVDEDITVTSLSSLQIDDCLAGVLHWALLDQSLDLVLRHELQHISEVLRRSNNGSLKVQAVVDNDTSVELEVTIVRQTNLSEGAALLQQGEVLRQGNLKSNISYCSVCWGTVVENTHISGSDR